jgi:chromosome segregation ATPase
MNTRWVLMYVLITSTHRRLVNHTALLAQEVASQKKVIKELRWQVSDAEEQLSASQAQAVMHVQSMEALQGETSNLQAQLDSANSAVEATRNELRAAHVEVVELNQKLLKDEQSIEGLAQEKIELQRHLAAQKEEVAAKGKVLKELHHQLAEEQRVSSEYSQQLQEKVCA